MRKVIASVALGPCEQQYDIARMTWLPYAQLHGFEIEVLTEHDPLTTRAERKALKLGHLRRLLQQSDFVLWLDSDVLILRQDICITGALFQDDVHGVVLEQYTERFNPNTGVWVWRNHPRAFELLDALESVVLPEGYLWVDQARLMSVLGWQLQPWPHGVKPVHPSPFLQHTGWLSPEWNPISSTPEARFRHYAGMLPEQRREAMLDAVADMVRTGMASTEGAPAALLMEIDQRIAHRR